MSRIDHLRTFIDVYRLQSFTGAAHQLGITQPAVSMHVAALESLIGKPLFERLPRGVRATPAAHELAQAVGPLIDGLESRLASYRAGSDAGGIVHLAAPPDFVHGSLTAAMSALMGQGWRLRIHTGGRDAIYAMLDASEVDLAIITASMPQGRPRGYARLLTERFLLVMAPAMAHRAGDTPTPERLTALPLIAFDEDLPLVRQVWLQRFGTAPLLQAALTMPDLRVIRELVVQGIGWSALPDYQCAADLKSGRLVSLTPPEAAPTNLLYLVWNESAMRHPRLQRVRDFLLQCFVVKN